MVGKIEEHNGKKKLIVNDSVLKDVLDSEKKTVGTEKFDNTEILTDTDHKLPNNILWKM